jgi:DNA (cytosine-5)-methyltransferase 1
VKIGNTLTGVSLFSGCGGSDLGAKRAGVDIVFANDCFAPATETYKKYKAIIASEDTDVQAGNIQKIANFPSCDILIGCYPCQSFTMGGPRSPEDDKRTNLYREFLRCLEQTKPRFFVVENVSGMQILEGGRYLYEQIKAFSEAYKGYLISFMPLDAKDFGVPADRKRIILVGVRRDVGAYYWFPKPTHGPKSDKGTAYTSHGDALKGLALDCPDEVYHPEKEPFSWWFMSRNRKRPWDAPAFTVVSNWRHVTLHPASPAMLMTSSDWRNGTRQKWEFSDRYEHLEVDQARPILERPRRLSWRECGILQTFPEQIEPEGSVAAKYWQFGNAVPPLLMEHIVRGITSGEGLKDTESPQFVSEKNYKSRLDAIFANKQAALVKTSDDC